MGLKVSRHEQNSSAIFSSQPIDIDIATKTDIEFLSSFPMVFSLIWFKDDDIELAIDISGRGFDLHSNFFVTPAELKTFWNNLLSIRRDCTGSARLRDYECSLRLAVASTEEQWPVCHFSLTSAFCGTLISEDTPPLAMPANPTTHTNRTTADTRLYFSVVDACVQEMGYLRLLDAIRETCRLTGVDD